MNNQQDNLTSKIGKKLNNAIKQSIAGKYLLYVIQAISLAVLARLFTPTAFGVYAAASVVCALFLVVAEAGLGPALIQNPIDNRNLARKVILLTGAIGVIFYTLLIAATPTISSLLDKNSIASLAPIVGISVIFFALSTLPFADLSRSTNFIQIAYIEVTAEVASLLVALFCWKIGLEELALAWKFAAFHCLRSIVGLVVFYKNRYQLLASPQNSTTEVPIDLVRFAANQLQFNILNYFSRNLDNLIIAHHFPTETLGIYDKAYQLMKYPLILITNAVSPAIQPSLQTLRNSPHTLRTIHTRLFNSLGMIGLATGAAVFIGASTFVTILLGEQWIEVASLLRILSITIPLQIIMSSSGGFFQCAGRSDLMLSSGRFSATTNAVFIIAGAWTGSVENICWGIVVSFSINFIHCYHLLCRHLFTQSLVGLVASARTWFAGQVTFVLAAITFLKLL